MVFKRGGQAVLEAASLRGGPWKLLLCVMGTSLPPGIKVIGGIKELTGDEYGVYVKRILPGGVAYADGELNVVLSTAKSETSQKPTYLFYTSPYQAVEVLPPRFSSSGGIFLRWQSL